MSVKALLHYVLEEVAIDGEEGTTVQELFQYVNDFYVKNRQERYNVCELLKSEAPRDIADEDNESDGDQRLKAKPSEEWGLPNVKEEFQEYVWDLLRQEKDFIVGPKNEASNLSLRDIVGKLKESKESSAKLRVYASEERRWRTLTGHGPDPKKVPNAVFQCLQVIGKFREEGIIQPELTKIAGQDKKSVAGRTTQLKDMGYIEKMSVLARSMNTSKLTLIKFAVRRDQKRAQVAKEAKNNQGAKVASGAENWTGDTIHNEGLIKAIIAELKSAKNGVVQRDDLKKRMGMGRSRFHWRALSRILRRVESLGVWRRIRVPLNGTRSNTKKGGPSVTVRAYTGCLKFNRDMTADDWRKLATLSKFSLEDEDEGDNASDAEHNKTDKGPENIDVDVVKEQLAQVDPEAIEEMSRDVPQWNMDVPLQNTVYDVVQSTGTNGISSMDVIHRVVGSFYYRPMDQLLHRMTDFPFKSQSPEYNNFAIIRETSITHRQTHYHYFTYETHQDLVKQGLAVERWALKGKKKGIKTGSTGGDGMHGPVVALDEFGFPAVDSSRLLKEDGTSSLADSQRTAQAKERIPTGGAGTGRPRKYEKGKEPYLAAKRRREAIAAGLEPEDPAPPRGRPRKRAKTGVGSAPKQRGRPRESQAAAAKTVKPGKGKAPGPPASTQTKEASSTSTNSLPVDALTTVGITETSIRALSGREGGPAKMADQLEFSATIPAADMAATPATGPKRRDRKPKNLMVAQEVTPASRSTRKRKAADLASETKAAVKRRKKFRLQNVEMESTPMTTEARPPRESSSIIPPTEDLEMPLAPEASVGAAKEVPLTTELAPFSTVNKLFDDETDALGEAPGTKMCPQGAARFVADKMNNPSIDGALTTSRKTEPLEQQAVAKLPGSEPTVAFEQTRASGRADSRPDIPPLTSIPNRAELPSFDVDGVSVEPETLEDDGNTYGTMGGMLALGRQQVVIELLAEHQGVFPGGNELRHAFNKRFKLKNPKAGVADRRLIRGVVQSLQYKGKANQLTFTFMTSRGMAATKKLLVDTSIQLDSELVTDAIRQIKSADGNLWFPPGTDLPDDVREKMMNPVASFSHAPQSIMEGLEFERLYPTSLEQVKKKREEKAAQRAAKNAQKAEEKKMRQEARENRRSGVLSGSAKFTEEQYKEARQRKAATALKAKFDRLRDTDDGALDYEAGPKTIWWEGFVKRLNGNSFLSEVDDVRQWEMLNIGRDDELLKPSKQDGLVMINHFGPEVEVTGDFDQSPVILDSQLGGSSMTAGEGKGKGKGNAAKSAYEPFATASGDVKRSRRRRPGTVPKKVSRRAKEMAAIHGDTGLDLENPSAALENGEDDQEVLERKDWSSRNKYTIPREDEDTLLIAVIIVRSLFGAVDRKIHWDVVQRALPHHGTLVLRRRWPRVRDAHKIHLKKLQTEFEEMYLEAYAKDALPPVDVKDPSDFDLAYHVKWFRESLKFPEANVVPDLPASRAEFERLYELIPEKNTTWRADYHNHNWAMGSRANSFICHAYQTPLIPDKDLNAGSEVVEFVKSIIKANVITDASTYNPDQAFAMIRAQPEDAVDEAFFDLTKNKVIAHRKENSRIAPGRNYELTDKFHASLRAPIDQKQFIQAIKYYHGLSKKLSQEEVVEVSPLLNDGAVACIFDLVTSGRIKLERQDYKAYPMGLVDGYETRSMPKDLVSFKLNIRAITSFLECSSVKPLPPYLEGKSGGPLDPIRIWYDINGKIIKGMWHRAVTAVLAMIIIRPGITCKELGKMIHPGMTVIECVEVVKWLSGCGAVRTRANGQETAGCWPKEGYYRALEGL